MAETTSARTILEDRLAELERRQKHVEADFSEPLSADSSERVTEMEDDAGLEAEANLIAKEILSVRRALGRIEECSYGICVRCGEQISTKRLLARPEAALCISCASKV